MQLEIETTAYSAFNTLTVDIETEAVETMDFQGSTASRISCSI